MNENTSPWRYLTSLPAYSEVTLLAQQQKAVRKKIRFQRAMLEESATCQLSIRRLVSGLVGYHRLPANRFTDAPDGFLWYYAAVHIPNNSGKHVNVSPRHTSKCEGMNCQVINTLVKLYLSGEFYLLLSAYVGIRLDVNYREIENLG